MDVSGLIKKAEQVRHNAYARYSKFKVGAALRAADGRVFAGCNVENASYGLSICAERVAVYNAISSGVREFTHLALVADSPTLCSPCGACRQVLTEIAPDIDVIMANLSGDVEIISLKELLPKSFSLKD